LNCYGAYVLDQKNKKIKKITAKVTMVATGGCGHVYKNTTNPKIATETELLLYIEPEVKFLTCNTSNFTQLQCILKETECCF
jgi:aspartate oxidase